MYRVPDHIPAHLKNVPELIRVWSLQTAGKQSELREELLALRKRRFKPDWAFALARAARSVALPGLALRFLERRVRSRGVPGSIRQDARPGEVAEYAVALHELGASHEAHAVFSHVDRSKVLNAAFLEGLLYVKHWDWAKARALFEKNFEGENTTPYARLSSRHYRAICLHMGEGRSQEALDAIDAIVPEIRANGFGQLEQNVRFTRVQLLAALERNDDARRELEIFRDYASGEKNSIFPLLAEQWAAILDLKTDPSARERLAAIRARFAEAEGWEWARACDYYLAIYGGDADAFHRAYFGTPYPLFRARLSALFAERFPGSAQATDSYVWNVPPARDADLSAPPVAIDALTGRNSAGKGLLKPGQVPQLLLLALSSDFYKPHSTGQLHERLYPGERFHPETSPARIHQALQRLRRWLRSEGVPLRIEESNGMYSLRAAAPVEITVRAASPEDVPNVEVTRAVERLADLFRKRPFSSTEAANALRVSRASANRYLREAVRFGALVARGRARATRYWLQDNASGAP